MKVISKHDAAINLYRALEAMKLAITLSGNGEVDRLVGLAYGLVKETGDALYPEILEEMRRAKADPLI